MTQVRELDNTSLASPEREMEPIETALLRQIADALWMPNSITPEEKLSRVQEAAQLLAGINPRCAMEGILATHMVAAHDVIMECVRRASIPEQPMQSRDLNLKHAHRMMSLYTKQLEALNKHRGKGPQRVVVEYVNVESGAQAVIGNVARGARGAKRRRRKTDSTAGARDVDPGAARL